MKIRPLPIVLVAASAALLLYAYDEPGLWKGALAIFLLWWADNDRKQVRAQQQEQQLIAEHAPELAGKDFVQSAAYVLEAIEAFKNRADPSARLRFAEALSEQQAQWAARGEPMPVWATLKLLREHKSDADRMRSDA